MTQDTRKDATRMLKDADGNTNGYVAISRGGVEGEALLAGLDSDGESTEIGRRMKAAIEAERAGVERLRQPWLGSDEPRAIGLWAAGFNPTLLGGDAVRFLAERMKEVEGVKFSEDGVPQDVTPEQAQAAQDIADVMKAEARRFSTAFNTTVRRFSMPASVDRNALGLSEDASSEELEERLQRHISRVNGVMDELMQAIIIEATTSRASGPMVVEAIIRAMIMLVLMSGRDGGQLGNLLTFKEMLNGRIDSVIAMNGGIDMETGDNLGVPSGDLPDVSFATSDVKGHA